MSFSSIFRAFRNRQIGRNALVWHANNCNGICPFGHSFTLSMKCPFGHQKCPFGHEKLSVWAPVYFFLTRLGTFLNFLFGSYSSALGASP